MCMIRDQDDCEKFVLPFLMLDVVDLTMEEFADEDDVDMTPRNDQWNYPYNLLPSSDEDESSVSANGFLEHTGEHNVNMFSSQSITTQDSSNDINQNTNVPRSLSSENINTENTNIAEINNSNQSSEERNGFEINIPQILSSMSTISNNLYGQASTSHN